MDDAAIVARFQQGDTDAFAELYERYVDPIYKFIYYKTMHRETAEDLTSQTFTKAIEAMHRFDVTKGTLSSWLYRIARNSVIDHYRTARSTEDIDGVYGLHDGTDLEVDADVRDKLEQVRRYLTTIKPEHREIIVLRLWNELSYREIAEVTGRSVNSCKVAFSRTMVQLREDMAFVLTALIVSIINLLTI